MRNSRKAAAAVVTVAAASLAAFGVMTATGGPAGAATNQAMSSCNLSGSELASASVGAQCTAGSSTILNPTGMTITVDPSFFTVLLGNTTINTLLGGALSANVSYSLTCMVNGSSVTSTTDTGFTVTSASSNTHKINLQSAVGSPAPNQCALSNLKVSSLVSATILQEAATTLGLSFTFGVSATGDTGIPGAIFNQAAADSGGAIPAICADDTGNGNANTVVQAFSCETDLADEWLQVSTHQFVHNGDCLTGVGGIAQIAACTANPGSSNVQVWKSVVQSSGYVELVNSANGKCLTAPSDKDGTALTLATCTGSAMQLWKVPGVTPA